MLIDPQNYHQKEREKGQKENVEKEEGEKKEGEKVEKKEEGKKGRKRGESATKQKKAVPQVFCLCFPPLWFCNFFICMCVCFYLFVCD